MSKERPILMSGQMVRAYPIISVRPERLHSISPTDCYLEGVGCYPDEQQRDAAWRYEQVKLFAELWDSIKAKKQPWSGNWWVWRIEFPRYCGV